jgi:hypothetical protein
MIDDRGLCLGMITRVKEGKVYVCTCRFQNAEDHAEGNFAAVNPVVIFVHSPAAPSSGFRKGDYYCLC